MSSEPIKPDRKEATPSPPAVWATMANDVREYDQDNVKRGKGDVDTLLVFVSTRATILFNRSVPNFYYTYRLVSSPRFSLRSWSRSIPVSNPPQWM